MTLEAGIVFAILAGALVLFVTGSVRSDVVALLVLVTLVLAGLLPPDQALSGFASEAVIATAGLLILSAGLVRTGVMRWIANRLDFVAGRGAVGLVALSTVLPGVLSGLVSDIGTVSLFIPVMLRLARSNNVSRRRLLLPLSMAVLAGGNLTLIGSSHNLVVHVLLRSSGTRGYGFFELAPLGITLVLAFALYTYLLGRRLIPETEGTQGLESRLSDGDRDGDLVDTYGLRDRLWEVWVEEESPAAGQGVRDLRVGREFGLTLLAVVREDRAQLPTRVDAPLAAHDTLLVEGRQERVEAFVEAHPGLNLVGHPRESELFPASNAELIEVVVPPRSPAVGKTLADLDTRARSGLTGVALWREGRPVRTDVGVTSLQAGDGLLLYGPRERTRAFDPANLFLWLHRPYEPEAPRELRHLGPWAAVIMVLVVASAALEWVPISVASMAGAVAMVLLGIVTPRQLYTHVHWDTVVLIGAMYPLGLAMEATGASDVVASLLLTTVGAFGPYMALLGILWVAMALTQFLHGAAVAIIMTPVALATAASMGVAPQAFATAVILGGAATYLLPVGHPAPLLVRRPGGYRTADYLRFGMGLVVITTIVAGVLLPLLWPF